MQPVSISLFSLPNIQIPGREHLLGLEVWVTFWHLAGEDGAFV